jgi:hypothetical protein
VHNFLWKLGLTNRTELGEFVQRALSASAHPMWRRPVVEADRDAPMRRGTPVAAVRMERMHA